MKKIISVVLSVMMLMSDVTVVNVSAAEDGTQTINADKTAQWTAQEKSANYDLRIHGYKDWETGAYIGFTLPDNFTSDNLVSATLKLYTKSATTAGKAYLYTAEYDDFASSMQYQGADEKPAYNETHIQWIDELPKSGVGEIDITDYIKGVADNTTNLAFRIDGKSYNNVCRQWIIGSLTNDTHEPQLVLTYSDGSGSVKNYKFKNGTENWTTKGTVTANTTDNYLALSGTSSISQNVTEIERGKYDLHARVKSDNMGNIAYVYAKAKGHPIMKTSASVTTYLNDGDWRDIYVRGVNIDEGECEVGLVLSQLSKDEIMIDSRVTNEPMPDGLGTVQIDSIELTDGTSSNAVFLTGGDINWLNFMEDMTDPVRYYDVDGTEKDAIQIMAENGANIVRLRLYNDPGKGHGDGSDYLPAGYQNPEDILDLAKRAKDKGMQIQLTFHYSDYWSNAETQLIPHEWEEEVAKLGTDASQDEKDAKVEQLLYDFTKDFMQKMHEQGTDPEYVSFGNEMHTGLLFDKGRATYDYGSTYRWSRLASLLKTASKATKEVSPDTKVILHLDGAGNWNKYNTFFTNCKTNEVPYDIIGISYYPYWYPEYDVTSLVSFCNRLIDTFDKDIMFMETGYSFANKNVIGGQDTRFTNVGPYQNTFGQSNMGQKAFMEELYSGFKQIKDGRCLGDLYWDPIMIQHEGLGWAYRESDDTVRENKNIAITLFDTTGHKLPAQSTFKDNGYITDTVTISGKITGVEIGKTTKLTVDNKEYTVTPDRFGGYVLRIPYEDEVNVTAAGDSENSYDIDMKMLSVAQGIDFTIQQAEETTAPTTTPTQTTAPTTTPTAQQTAKPAASPTVKPTARPKGDYTAPVSASATYNMNLDWQFLLPSQADTLTNALNSSRDSANKYFYETGYNASQVTGLGYKDTHGVLVEGDKWTTVSIPHAINGLQAFAHNGVDAGEKGASRCFLLYRKEFTVPEDGKKFVFELEGIRQAAYVWVNGKEVGYYEAGIAAMGFDITKYVTPGQSAVIAIAEDGTSSRGMSKYISETKPAGSLFSVDTEAFDWKTQWGLRNGSAYQWNTADFNESQIGLIYDAYLHVTGDIYQTFPLYNNLKTTGNSIYADNFDIKGKTAEITVDAEVRNESAADKNITLEVNIVDPDGNLKWLFKSAPKPVPQASDNGVVYATTVKDSAYNTDEDGKVIAEDVTTWETVDVTHITASYNADDVRFWNIDDPYMYDVYTILRDENNEVIDVQKKTTGFRKISYSIDDGLEINDRYAWLPGYAQRSTDEWAVIGSANDWLNDYDMKLLKESNADFIRWMHVAPKPAQVRSSDKYGVAVVVPAGDKEGDASGRNWSQRMEAMRDVMIYYRNSPSVVFWESGNNAMSVSHAKEMMKFKNALDPHGMRFIGSRSLQNAEAIKESDYAGTMLGNYGTKAKEAMDKNGKWGPVMETEYNREEAPRRVWDDYSPPDYDYVNKYLGSGAKKQDGYDIWDMTQEDLSLSAVKSYAGFYNSRVGGSDGSDIYSAIAMMVWSDSNMHNRNSGTENGRTSGRVDAIRQIKDSYNAVKTAQSDVPAVDILGHWSYPAVTENTYNYFSKSSNGTYEVYDKTKKLKRDPTKKTVYVIGSADVAKVELYRITEGDEEATEERIGTCDTPTRTFIYEFPNTDVTKGDAVKAVAYDARNNVIAEDEIERTYEAYSLRLTRVTSDAGWAADGADIALFDVEVLDKNGNVCALNYDRINFTYSGEGVYLGGYNSGMGEDCFQNTEESAGISNYFGGAKDEVSTLHKDYVYAENGTNRIFVKSTRNEGTFTLNATLCDASGNPTSITASESVTSTAVETQGGLTKVMPASEPYTYADSAPVIESVPSMISLSDVFEIDWTKAVKVEKVDTTVYYTVNLNGSELTLLVSAYEGLANSVFAPVMPILDELKKLGAKVEYTYDDTIEDNPKLTVIVNKGEEGKEHTLWCHPSENILWVDDDSDLPNDSPTVKDGQFCFELSMILGYIDGVKTSQDTENLIYSISYGAEDIPSATSTPTASATPTSADTPATSTSPSATSTPTASTSPSATSTPTASTSPSATTTPTASTAPTATNAPEEDSTPKIDVEINSGDAASIVKITNKPENAVGYAAKYDDNGVLTKLKIVNDGDTLDFVPDKIFLWENMKPIAMWKRQ